MLNEDASLDQHIGWVSRTRQVILRNISGLVLAIKRNPDRFDPQGLLMSKMESIIENISSDTRLEGDYVTWSYDYNCLLDQAQENGIYFKPEEIEEEPEEDDEFEEEDQ